MNSDLQRSNEELERFAYVASHDLQEPLRMVASYTELLSRRYRDSLDDDAREFIDFASDGARRMQRLIADLLEFSRIKTRGGRLEPVDLGETIENVLHDLQLTIRETGTEVHVSRMPRVMADPGQIESLFQNVISNAIKYRGDKLPIIEINAMRQNGFWNIMVSDNGIGISKDHYDRIFVLFQRLHGRKDYAGTGIGLALCKRIVERHGGRIWLESTVGVGTDFHFTLIAAEGQEKIVTEKHEEAADECNSENGIGP